jgi:AcrR family transcriptional regulator
MVSHDARERLLDAAYRSFYRKGFSRSGLDEIAAEAGVTKRTLYYHFPSKDDLLAAMLERQSGPALQQIQQWAEHLQGDAKAWISAPFDEVEKWGSQPWFAGTGFSRVVMELADLPGHPARAVASTHKKAVEAWVAARLAGSGEPEPDERARELVLLLEGAVMLMLVHRDPTYTRAARDAAMRLVCEQSSQKVV